MTFRKFQFPSNGKLHSNSFACKKKGKLQFQFQFPSNGKLHSNCSPQFWSRCPSHVSIPFKRETAFKQQEVLRNTMQCSKVSIPFKRETAFKQMSGSCQRMSGLHVSIPFKRETAFKQVKAELPSDAALGFNSLQTGNCIQTGSIK